MSGLITLLQQQWQARSFASERDLIAAIRRGLEEPPSQATSLFLEKIVIPVLEREPLCHPLKNDVEKLKNWMGLRPTVPSFLTALDLDGDTRLSPIEVALHAYAVEDALQRMVNPLPEHSIRVFIQNLSAFEAERTTCRMPLTDVSIEKLPVIAEQLLEGEISFDAKELASSAKELLASLQTQLKSEPENREWWMASFQVWEVVLELSRLKSSENYLSLMKEYAEYYEPEQDASQYSQLFHYLSSLRWISVQLADAELQKKIPHALTSEDLKNLLRIISRRVYDIHQLAELRVEGLRSHEFFIQHFGFHPAFFAEEVLTAETCPNQERVSVSEGEDIPYNVVESFEKWCRCFCPILFGQNSTVNSIALSISQDPAFEEWLQPYWARFMNDPNSFDAILNHPYQLIPSNPAFYRIGLSAYWHSKVGAVDWEEVMDSLQRKGVTLYAHRMGDREERRSQAYKNNYGVEVDVGFTRDHKWVMYHELQAPSGPYVIDLSSEQLQKENVSLLETLRTGDHPLIIDDKTNNYSPRANLEGAAASLVAALKPVGNNILIDSIDPVFLADVKKEIDKQNLPFKLAYLFMEYGVLEKFAEEVEGFGESREFPFDTLMVYGKDLRRLQDEKKEALEILHQQFKIVIAEDDPRALKGLEFDGLIAAGLPGVNL